jgi:predicted Zn-dependent peptidase
MSLEDIIQGVRSVSRDDVVDLAASILRPDAVALTLLGDVEKKKLDLGAAFH